MRTAKKPKTQPTVIEWLRNAAGVFVESVAIGGRCDPHPLSMARHAVVYFMSSSDGDYSFNVDDVVIDPTMIPPTSAGWRLIADTIIRYYGPPEDMEDYIFHNYALIEALYNTWDDLMPKSGVAS